MAVWRNSILEDYLKQPISMALREEAVLRLSAESAAVYREILVPKLGWNGKRHDMQGNDATQTHTLWSLERKPRYQEGLVKPHWNTPRLQPCEDRQLMNCTRSGLGSQGRLPEDGAWKTIDKGNTIFLTVEYIMIRYHYRTWTIDGTKTNQISCIYIYIMHENNVEQASIPSSAIGWASQVLDHISMEKVGSLPSGPLIRCRGPKFQVLMTEKGVV